LKKSEGGVQSKSGTIEITLKRSAIGRPSDQKGALIGLGFKRLHQTVTREDTPAIRGMVTKVSHLVEIRQI